MKKNSMILSILSAFGLLILDRVTKYYALALGCKEFIVNKYVSFCLIYNRGISWGIFNSESTTTFTAVTILISLITAYLIYYTWREYQKGSAIFFELLVCIGSLSNILDRFLYSGVIDFILIHKEDWVWPVFNVADVCIVVGICGMLFKTIKK